MFAGHFVARRQISGRKLRIANQHGSRSGSRIKEVSYFNHVEGGERGTYLSSSFVRLVGIARLIQVRMTLREGVGLLSCSLMVCFYLSIIGNCIYSLTTEFAKYTPSYLRLNRTRPRESPNFGYGDICPGFGSQVSNKAVGCQSNIFSSLDILRQI